jgi:hypothetical protein
MVPLTPIKYILRWIHGRLENLAGKLTASLNESVEH